jgi:hypothetical protein
MCYTQVQRRLRQPRVAPLQERGAKQAQAVDCPFQQVPDERFWGRVAFQRVEVALDDGGSRFFVHGEASPWSKGFSQNSRIGDHAPLSGIRGREHAFAARAGRE